MRARLPREDELAFAEQMHGTKRRWFWAFLVNGLLLVSLLGLPYARGMWRAQDTLHGYAQALSCLLGVEPAPEPGLQRIPALEAYFSQQLLRANSLEDGTWLARCDDALAQLVPAPAIFVWPPTKDAEARSREAADVVRRELAALKGYRAPARVPRNPMRALVQLQEVLEEHVVQAGWLEAPPQPAIRTMQSSKALPYPTRIPIYAGADAVLTLWGSDASLSVVAVDRTGVSYLHAESGHLRTVRHPRPKLLEAFLRKEDQNYLIWALARERCRTREGGCEGKAMGISQVALPLTQLSHPRWLASHPTGRLDHSLMSASSTQNVWFVAAEGSKGSEVLRGFWLPKNPGGDLDTALPPQRWLRSTSSAGRHLTFLQHGVETTRIAAHTEANSVHFVHGGASSETGTKTTIASLRANGEAWAQSCPEGSETSEGHFAFGTESELIMATLSARGIIPMKPEALPLGPVLHARDASRDRVQMLCAPNVTWTLASTLDDQLYAFVCEAGASECRKQRLAEHVTGYAAIDSGRSILLAFAGAGDSAQVQLQRFTYSGEPQGKPQQPSSCWAPRGGLCEQPYLHKLGARILLSAREHTDLLALESDDDGLTWHGLAEFPPGR